MATDFFAVSLIPAVALFVELAAAFLLVAFPRVAFVLGAVLLPTTVSDPGPGVNVDSSPVDHWTRRRWPRT